MKKSILLAVIVLAAASCRQAQRSYDIVPYPNSLQARAGEFDMRNAVIECDPAFDESVRQVVDAFSQQLARWVGDEASGAGKPIRFIYDPSLGPEAYTLDVKPNRIDIWSSARNGTLYALQTLRQLMPADIYGTQKGSDQWTVPCVKIADSPRFAYRGMHLDVARHFFDANEVKRYLDVMAVHKLNTLHWHLTDDQGWRVEIERYPELTTIGGFRDGTVIRKNWDEYDGIRYGGFYTQDEIRDVVAYADSLGITVIPEIDLPGHMIAALAAYPELGCTGGPYKVWGRWGVADEVLCPGNPKTFEFIEGVLTEVMELFPSKYIHIGGDECPKVRWEKCPKCQKLIAELGLKDTEKFTAEHYLQSHVMARAEDFLARHGRRIIGWDEILEGEVSPDATIMSWRGLEGAIEAARMGRDAILTPTSYCYFDYYQGADTEHEPFGIGGFVPIERVYSLDPAVKEGLTEEQAAHILGVQANMWTEYIATPEHLFYMLLPRLAALSEVQWCADQTKDWNRFINSLTHTCDIYTRMGYNYCPNVFGITGTRRVDPERACVELTLSTPGGVPIYYTLDGTDPTTGSERYTAPLEIRKGCTVKAIVDREGVATRMYVKEFADSKSLGRPATLNTDPNERYRFTGATLLTDGVYGPHSYAGGEWLGYQLQPMVVTLDMGGDVEYSTVDCNMLIQKSDDIFPPASVTVFTSADGNDFAQVGKIEIPASRPGEKDGIENYTVRFEPVSARWLRVEAQIAPEIPAWHPAHGRKPFIFVDEIAVN